jgi:hypothetical protein
MYLVIVVIGLLAIALYLAIASYEQDTNGTSEGLIAAPPAAYSAYLSGSTTVLDPITNKGYVASQQTPNVGYYGRGQAYTAAAATVGPGYVNALRTSGAVSAADSTAYATALKKVIPEDYKLLQNLYNLMDTFPDGKIDGVTLDANETLSWWTTHLQNNLTSIVKDYNGLISAGIATTPVMNLISTTTMFPIYPKFIGYFPSETAFCTTNAANPAVATCSETVPYLLDSGGHRFSDTIALANTRGHRYVAMAMATATSGFAFTFKAINSTALAQKITGDPRIPMCTDTPNATCGCAEAMCPPNTAGSRIWSVYQVTA